jgi:acetyl-CoA carboxylase carboxyltransferase component
MSIENIAQAKAEIAQTSAYKILEAFFEDGQFTEIAPLAKSEDTYAEVVAGFGLLNECTEVYAFAQNADLCGGAMSKAQAAKIKKVYDLALKTGMPVVGFYNSKGGRLNEENALLAGYGDVLNSASKLSGVVPQVSVVLGDCIGTGALNAVSADFVIATKDSRLSLDTTGDNSNIEYNAENGIVNVVAEDEKEAIEKAREIFMYLPENNRAYPYAIEWAEPGESDALIKRIVDEGSVYKLSMEYGDNARTVFACLDGTSVGVVNTLGGKLSADDANKIAKFVRFCDAFSIPVLTFVNTEGFEDIKSAVKVSSAYGEATTAMASVITGSAYGAAYIALAGTGANADFVYALPEAVISPVNPEAVVLINSPEELNVPVAEQAAVVDKYAKENLSAEKAAENGYVDDVLAEEELREALKSARNIWMSKRVETLPKKHSTI